MKTLFLCLHLVILSISINAQSIPNAGFEIWNFFLPFGWEATYMGDTGTIYKTTDAHSGQYAVALKMTGDTSSWCSRTVLLSGPSYNQPSIPYSGRPFALAGYYKFFPVNDDTMNIFFELTQNGNLLGSGNFFSYAPTGDTYQYFEIPVNYLLNGYSDAALIMAMVDKGPIDCDFIGSLLLLDDLAFINSPSGTEENNFSENNDNNFSLSQLNDYTSIKYFLAEKTAVNISIFDISGKKMAEIVNSNNQPSGQYTAFFDTGNFPGGLYFFRIETNNYEKNVKVLVLK